MADLFEGGLRVRRTIHAPREDIFDAWVNPERLRTWWGPPGFTVEAIDGDLRVGGRYRIVMRPPEGGVRELVWTFQEISPPERLVYRWQWVIGGVAEPETHVTVVFHDAGGRTEIELTHVDFADGDERAHHVAGWDGCLGRLPAILNRMV